MSSFLTPKRRDRVKQRSTISAQRNDAQSMSPSSSRSGNGNNHGNGNNNNDDDDNHSNNHGTTRISIRDSYGRNGGGHNNNSINNSKYHAMTNEDSPPNSRDGSPADINATSISRHVVGTTGGLNLNTSINSSSGSCSIDHDASSCSNNNNNNMAPRTVTPTMAGLAPSVSRSSSWGGYSSNNNNNHDEGFYRMGTSSSSHQRHSNYHNNNNNNNNNNSKSRVPLSPGRTTSGFRQRPVGFTRLFGGHAASASTSASGSIGEPASPNTGSGRTPTCPASANNTSTNTSISQSPRSEYGSVTLPYLRDDALVDSHDQVAGSVGDNNNKGDDDDMPMDERMDVKKKNSGRRFYLRRATNQTGTTQESHHPPHHLNTDGNTSHNITPPDGSCSATSRTMTPTKEVCDIVTMSPSGDSYMSGRSSTGWARIIDALNGGSSSSRPPRLNREECILWDALQTAIVNDRNEHLAKRTELERSLQESTNHLNDVSSRETDLQLSLSEAHRQLADMKDKYEAGLSKYRALAATALSGGNSQQLMEGNGGGGGGGGDVDGNHCNSRLDESVGTTPTAAAIQEKVEYLERRVKEQESAMKVQQTEHDAAVRAIQRVLADITAEKALLEKQIEEHRQESQVKSQNETDTTMDSQSGTAERETTSIIVPSDDGQHDATDTLASVAGCHNDRRQSKEVELLRDELKLTEQQKQTAKREADKKARRLLVLERDIKVNKTQLNTVTEERNALVKEAEAAKSEAEGQRNNIEVLNAQMKDLENEIVAQKDRNELLHAEIRSLKKAREDALKEVEVANSAANAAKEAAKAAKDAVMIATTDETSNTGKLQDEREISGGPHDTQPKMSPDDIEKLQRNLADTTSSLENAKKIIASLENANGSLALDLRAKLKGKEEELSISQKEAEERKRRLDSLATELRDLQRKQGDFEKADMLTKAQVIKQKALMGHLENSLSDLQSAVAVYEASTESSGIADSSGMDEISEILGDTLYAVKVTLEATEQFVVEIDDMSVANSDIESNPELGRHIDAIIRNDREAAAQDFRLELDQKKVAVKRLEEALKKQNEEMRKLRLQLDSRARGSGESDEQLRAEIQSLRQQCSTNMEVLAKKERELSVLRSSLKVDDNDVGYISDDGSDDDDNEEEGEAAHPPSKLTAYGPAEAEALATILSQTSGGIDLSSRTRELESLKKELLRVLGEKEDAAKELRSERESLANAKMIISSLEKANKGMMEDLRSRLQDSNTAIASLLDKAMENERNSDLLREEVEKLNQKRFEDQQKHEAEVARLMEQINTATGRGGLDLVDHRNEITTEETPSEEKKEDGEVPLCQ